MDNKFNNILNYLKKICLDEHIGAFFIYIEQYNRFSNDNHTLELSNQDEKIILTVYNGNGKFLEINCTNINVIQLGDILFTLNVIDVSDKLAIYL